MAQGNTIKSSKIVPSSSGSGANSLVGQLNRTTSSQSNQTLTPFETALAKVAYQKPTIGNQVPTTANQQLTATLNSMDEARLGNGTNKQLAATTQDSQLSDIVALINSLNQAKQAQAIADLGKARDSQLSNLTAEEATIKPAYYDKRNSTAATNMMGRRTLAEELASRGETNSGVADQANISANMSLQGETGLLNRQEASDISDIARRRTGVQNAYESDVASAKANLEALAMQNLIDQYNADRQYKLQEAGVTGTYNGSQTLDALNSSRNFALNEAGVTGTYNGNQTLDALNAYRNYALNEAGLTGTYNGNQTLAAQNQTFNQNLATKQYNQDVKQQKLDNLYRQQTFDYQKSRDAVSDSQWQQQMNLNLRQQTFSEAQAKIDNALARGQIAREDAATALQWAQFNAEQDPNSLDNQLKKAQLNSSNTSSGTTSTVDDFASTINSLYVISPNSNNNYKGSIDTAGIQAYLDKLMTAGVDDSIVDSLAARYGIQ